MVDDRTETGDGRGRGARPGGAAWGAPLERLDVLWQEVESRLCAAVLVAEIVSLTVWVALRGLATDYVPGGNASGIVCRSLLSAGVLGAAAHAATRGLGQRANRVGVTSAVVVGLAAGRLWAHAGVYWSSNFLNFLQNASVMMLIGGLRGLATRLTLWLALIGRRWRRRAASTSTSTCSSVT